MLHIISLGAFFTSFLLAMYVLLKEPTYIVNKLFFLMCLLDGISSFFLFEFRTSESIDTAWLWFHALAFWPFILITGLHFILAFTKNYKILQNKLTYIILYLPAALITLIDFSTKLYSPNIFITEWGWSFTIASNWVSLLINIWVLSISVLMVFYLAKYYIKATDYVEKKQAWLILIALIFMLIVALSSDLFFPLFGIYFPEISDLGSAVGNIVIAYAIVKYELFKMSNSKVTSSIIRSIPSGVILTNEKSIIVYANNSATKTLKALNNDILGLSIDECIGNIDCITESKIQNFHEKSISNCSGNTIQVLLLVNEYKDKFDILRGFAIVFHDITILRKVENEKRIAMEASHLKTAFLANMSHEIRTPLNNIIGFTEVIQKKTKSEEKREEFIKLISENSKQLSHIINEIIDISKIESGKMKTNNNKMFINELLEGVYANYKENRLLKEKNLKLLLYKDLGDEKSYIFSDEGKITQILTNLLDNAIKFTINGSIEFGYTLLHDKKHIEFYVKDTGIGINKSDFDLIFDRFSHTEERMTKHQTGAGLGLSIAKGLVELLRGKIYLESTKKLGTTIYFTIPYDPVMISGSSNKVSNSDLLNWNKKRVLLVEDNISTVKYMLEILNDVKAEVIHAKNGEEAIEKYQNNEIDFVIMDIQLPDISGIEVMHKIKSPEDQTPFFALTAYAMSDEREKFIKKGFNEYLSKPLRENQLISLIDKYST